MAWRIGIYLFHPFIGFLESAKNTFPEWFDAVNSFTEARKAAIEEIKPRTL